MSAEDTRTHELLERLIGAVEASKIIDNSVVTPLSTTGSLRENETDNLQLTTMSKLELAQWWLQQHPEHKNKSDRWLEANARPMQDAISRTWWNKAKKG